MLIAIAAVLAFVGAADGDTLTVRELATGATTVLRLAEVDAPERSQPYSQVSRRNLNELCRGRPVEFRRVDVDRYGRTVAHVVCDGVNVNWRQVEDGLAWCFTRYLKQPEECLPRERAAREAKKALWREANPQAPWDFRAAKRGQGAPTK
ncbi:MAG: thermonuclease family protein [Burkholderiales bacterium]|jgi:endonuclease YncB( thermonuclease family)|nr:thermonuclease family protein [Burkholderiales bacterium]